MPPDLLDYVVICGVWH